MPLTGTAGVALGGVFGFIFVFTCILSVIKAVRDRKKIKKRIAERERQKAQNSMENGRCVCSIEEPQEPSSSKSNGNSGHTNGTVSPTPVQSVSLERLELPDGKSKLGVDNLTYAHSNTDIKQNSIIGDLSEKSKYSAETEDRRKAHAPSKRSVSNDVIERRGKCQLNHLPQECLAVQKNLRRHSYELAVCEHSWLPAEPPSFQSSNSIIQTYSHSVSNTRKSTVGFENKAFDKDDHKKT